MLYNEIIVLETLCFDLSVEHPHMSLLELESQLKGKGSSKSFYFVFYFTDYYILVSSSSIRKAWMLLYQR